MAARSWRKEPNGNGWRLVAGRGTERRRLQLRVRVGGEFRNVTADEAERARAAMDEAEVDGTAGQVLALYAEEPDGREAATAHLLGDQQRDAWLPAPRVEYDRLTLAAYFEDYYRKPRSEKRPATWRTEAGHWRRLLEGLGHERLGKLVEDRRIFHRWVRDLMVERSGGTRRGTARSEATKPTGERNQPASGAYKRLLRSALQALLTFAYTEGHIDTLTMLGEGGALRIEGSTRPAREKPIPLSLDELGKLLDACTSTEVPEVESAPSKARPMLLAKARARAADGLKHRALFAVATGEGLRPSEVHRLRWESTRWSTRTLDVPGTKTDASADEIPLTPIAYRELRAWWMAQGQPTSGVMFPSGVNEKGRPVPYANESGYKRALATAATRAGIDRRITPYVLRASFATIAWSLGIPRDVARRILRHTDEAMLAEVYERPRPADLVAKVAAFDIVAG